MGPGGARAVQGTVSDMLEEHVVQPLLVTTSALNLATECVRMILKARAQPPLPLLRAWLFAGSTALAGMHGAARMKHAGACGGTRGEQLSCGLARCADWPCCAPPGRSMTSCR